MRARSGELRVLMQARRLGIGRNPLRRRSDRIEAALSWCALVAALLVVPVGAAIGTSVGNASDASAQQQRAALHEVPARTLGSTEHQVPIAPGAALARVPVSYVDLQGVAREGVTSVVIGTPVGSQVTIWLDRSGTIVTAPRSPGDGAAYGGTVGVLIVLGAWLLLWGSFRLARIPLDRDRLRDWDNEWITVAPRWLRGQR